MELRKLVQREGFASRRLTISWDQEVVHLLAKTGFHPRLGARPLQRTIDELVIVPIARQLAESPEQRNMNIRLVSRNGQIDVLARTHGQ